MERLHRWVPTGVFAVSLALLIAGASGGSGWDRAADRADYLVLTAASPLHDALAAAAAQLPIGEVGFRLALLAAVLAALALTGVVVAVRQLLPKDPFAGVIAAVVLVLAPPFREAGSPALLAACGVVWAIAAAASHARTRSVRDAALALAAAAAVAATDRMLASVRRP